MTSKLTKYIELIGVAGVGKTTVAKILLKELKKNKVSINLRTSFKKNLKFWIQVFYNIFLTLVYVPEIFLLFVAKNKNSYKRTPHYKKTILNLLIGIIIDSALIKYYLKNGSQHMINDEGFVGKIVSLSVLTEISEKTIEIILTKLLPKQLILIFVTSSPLKSLERESKRNYELPFFNDMQFDLKKKFFFEANNIYTSLSKNLFLRLKIDMILLDNSNQNKDLVNNIINEKSKIIKLIRK